MEIKKLPITLNSNQQEYLETLFKVFSTLDFKCPLDWQWNFIHSVFASLSGHIERNETNFIDKYLLCGANGTGKTTVVIYTILWLMFWAEMTHPDKKVKGVIVSGSADQLFSVVWEDLKSLILNNSTIKHLFVVNDRRLYMKKRPNIWIEPRVANPNNINSLAGVHADIVIVLLEEAPVIPNDVLPVVFRFFAHTTSGCMGFLFLTGNPVNKGSFFYEIMESENEEYDSWNRFRISREDVAPDNDLSKDLFSNELIKMYGEDSDQYRMGVLGLHALSDTAAFIPEYAIQAALERPFVQAHGPYTLSIDVAGGLENSDFSVLYYMAENVILDIYHRKVNPEELLNEAISWVENRPVNRIIVDEVGIGQDITGRLQRRFRGTDIIVIGFKGNAKPYDPWRFPDQNTEVTWKLKEWLELYGKIPKDLPYLDVLLRQLRAYKSVVNPKGFYTLESKSKMNFSPDIGDAARMCFAGGKMATVTRVLPIINRNQYYRPVKKLM